MKKTIPILTLMLLLLALAVTGLDNEVIKQDITSFEWSFDNPFGTDKESYKSFWTSYVDNFGCDDVNIKLYYELPVKISFEECISNPPNCSEKEVSNENGTTTVTTCAPNPDTCSLTSKVVTELYDLELGDYLIPEDSRIVVKGNRKAKTGFQSCDMNIVYDDGEEYYDAKYGGTLGLYDVEPRAWWNSTWNVKYQINVSNEPYAPYKLTINNASILSNCGSEGDIRFVNATEDGVLVYNISEYNAGSDFTAFINTTLVTNSFYLYCNATTPQNTTGIPLLYDVDERDAVYYSFDDADNNATDDPQDLTPSNNDGDNDGADVGVTGVFNEAYDFELTETDWVNTNNINIFPWGTNEASICLWANWESTGDGCLVASQENGGGGGFYLCYLSSKLEFNKVGAGAGAKISQAYTPSGWQHICAVTNGTGMYLYTNGTLNGNNADTANLIQGGATRIFVGARPLASVSEQDYFDGVIDEVSVWNISLDWYDVNRIMNSQYPFYSEFTYNISAASIDTALTSIDAGIFNKSYSNVSLVLAEGKDFTVWANYTYDTNGSSVYPNAWCNWTAPNILQEDYYENGANETICGSGCDHTNRTYEVTGLDTEGFIKDYVRLRLCRDDVPTSKTYTVHTGCGYIESFSFATVPECDVGFDDYFFNTSLCGGVSSVNVSVWTSGTPSANELVLVDGLIGLDREHNHSQNLTWNATEGLFHGRFMEYYEHGNYLQDVDCYALVGGIENESTAFNVTAVNIPPYIFIDTIWDSYTGLISFANNSVMRRVGSTINITGGCSDDDLSGGGANLSFSNGTLIDQLNFNADGGVVPSSINYTITNFSVGDAALNGSVAYDIDGFCNDTTGNYTYLSKRFTAINSRPTVSWTNSSPLVVGLTPAILNFSCSDTEGASTTGFIYVNNTNMSVPNATGVSGYSFNLPEGTYNLSVRCDDGLRNSTNDDLTITYTEACIIQLFGIADGGSYRDNTFEISANCSNSVALNSCEYQVGHYVYESFECSGENITLEIGKNDVTFRVTDGGLNVSTTVRVFAKKMNPSLGDYVFIFLLIVLAVAVFGMVMKANIPIFDLLFVIILGVIGYISIAFSLWISIIIWVFALGFILFKVFGR